jgi:hypothetical protein
MHGVIGRFLGDKYPQRYIVQTSTYRLSYWLRVYERLITGNENLCHATTGAHVHPCFKLDVSAAD